MQNILILMVINDDKDLIHLQTLLTSNSSVTPMSSRPACRWRNRGSNRENGKPKITPCIRSKVRLDPCLSALSMTLSTHWLRWVTWVTSRPPAGKQHYHIHGPRIPMSSSTHPLLSVRTVICFIYFVPRSQACEKPWLFWCRGQWELLPIFEDHLASCLLSIQFLINQ